MKKYSIFRLILSKIIHDFSLNPFYQIWTDLSSIFLLLTPLWFLSDLGELLNFNRLVPVASNFVTSYLKLPAYKLSVAFLHLTFYVKLINLSISKINQSNQMIFEIFLIAVYSLGFYRYDSLVSYNSTCAALFLLATIKSYHFRFQMNQHRDLLSFNPNRLKPISTISAICWPLTSTIIQEQR